MKELVVEIPGLVPDTVSVALKKDLTISEDLEHEVNRTASQFGYYAVLAEKAEARYNSIKLAFEVWRAGAEKEIIAAKGPFKTVKELDRIVIQRPKWRKYKALMNEYESYRGILKQIAKAFEAKKDLVQTRAADRRKEVS